jgi:outer membrane cobalamin receptor
MNQPFLRHHPLYLLCLGSLGLASTWPGCAALAQTPEPATAPGSDSLQKVVITGSRIASPAAASPSPLQILSSADIAASGATNLQDLLQKIPPWAHRL